MIDNLKIINFLQDFSYARLRYLQQLNDVPSDNLKSILLCNVVSKKGDIFVHNTKKTDEDKLVALDILCNIRTD